MAEPIAIQVYVPVHVRVLAAVLRRHLLPKRLAERLLDTRRFDIFISGKKQRPILG